MRWVALALAAFVATACAGAPRGVTVTGPTWRATVATVPWPPRGIAPHRVVVTLDGRDVRGPVQLQTSMPGMSHEGTAALLRPTGGGQYEGTVTFEMAGTWVLTLLVGSPPQAASVAVAVHP
jgi:YtkA-like protein